MEPMVENAENFIRPVGHKMLILVIDNTCYWVNTKLVSNARESQLLCVFNLKYLALCMTT